jgi:hypothetical protein
MFIERAELEGRWRGERPAVLARFGDRWALGNHAAGR